MKKLLTAGMAISFAVPFFSAECQAEIRTTVIPYQYQDVTMQGFLAWDDALTGKRPGVLVIHEYWGLNDYARERAKQLAGLGYVAFAADMYGEGRVAEHPKDASAMAKAVRKDTALWRGRAQSALKTLRAQPQVDTDKVAAIGYCFGGSTVLELAYAGADVDAVVSFHGGLTIPESTSDIKSRILILHGADDPHASPDTISALKKKLDQGKVNYSFIAYPGAVHGFTNKRTGNDPAKGVAYNIEADWKSWQEMKKLFTQLWISAN